jgi:TatD DNase family protein
MVGLMLHRPWPFAPRYADSHVHLDQYDDASVAAMLRRARAAGVVDVLTAGTGIVSSRGAVAIARRHAGVLAAVGVHPRYAGGIDLYALRTLALESADVVRAIGEIGLDRTSAAAPIRVQMVAFEMQLRLAAEVGLPVVVHAAGAHRDVAAVLAAVRPRLPAVIVHYFAGDSDDLGRYLDLDCHVSFGRLALKPEGEGVRRLIPAVPADRLLVETDCYPLPGRTTEPKDVVELVQRVADLRGERMRGAARQARANLRAALGMQVPPGRARRLIRQVRGRLLGGAIR